MPNRPTKKFLFIAVPALIISSLFYWNYNSIENKTRRTLARDAIAWFNTTSTLKSQNPEEIIKLKLVVYDLSDDWYLEYDDYELYEATYSEYLIKQYDFFRNSKTNEQRIYSNLYYFSLDINYPIPLKKQASVVLGNDSKIIDEKYLWEGDFDSFCKKP